MLVSTLLSPAVSLAAISRPVTARHSTDDKKPAVTVRYAQGASSSGWIKFELFAGSMILIPAEVNGKKVFALLDSGASSTVLDSSFASDIGLCSKGHHIGGADGGPVAYGNVKGVDLQLGKLRWRGQAVAIDLTAVSAQVGRPLPIILGGALFSDTIVDIDFAGRRIAFRDPKTFVTPPTAIATRLIKAADLRAISISVEDHPAKLLFDIGNAGTLNLSPRFWGRAGFLQGRRTSTTYSGGAGGMQEQQIARLDRLTVGGAQFRGVPVELQNANAVHGDLSQALDGNLGIGVLSRFHLIVDFPHARVLFAPPVDQARPFPINHIGLTVRPGKAGLTVVHIARGSPAALVGLSVGDVITTVDGAPKSALANSSWQYGKIGNTVHLGMLDGRQVNLKYGDYF